MNWLGVMQLSIPGLSDLSNQSKAAHKAYCLTSANTIKAEYGRKYLLTHRLLDLEYEWPSYSRVPMQAVAN